jgi:hypothetical protein
LLAVFGRYLTGLDDRGQNFPVAEPQLKPDDWKRIHDADPRAILQLSSFRALGLADSEVFVQRYMEIAKRLAERGVAETLLGILR